MKRKLFVGSSSGSGLEIAKKVAAHVESNCGEWIECDIWDRGNIFGINSSFLDSLLRASQRYHYGMFVATKDDPTVKKGSSIVEPRDNVIFEMGLFLGSMGVSRSFLLVEKGAELPTDFQGITVPQFSIEDEESLLPAVDKIIEAIEDTRKTFNLKPIPSAALALGYFENFLKPFAIRYWANPELNNSPATLKILLPNSLSTIKNKADLETMIRIYEQQNPSKDVSIFQPGTRPVIKRKEGNDPFYWDIPTTIFTLKQLFDKIPSHAELIGINKKQEQWLRSELYEFGSSIIEQIGETLDFQGISTEVALIEIKDRKATEVPLQSSAGSQSGQQSITGAQF
jgi:hypothetical protein